MEFQSQELLLRLLQPSDEALYVRLYSDRETMRHIGPPLDHLSALRSFSAACRSNKAIPPKRRTWAIEAIDQGRTLGLIGLSWSKDDAAELGLVLLPDKQGKGVATAAISALLPGAFADLGVERLYARHSVAHGMAGGLMATTGFSEVSTPSGQDRCWELTVDQWQVRHAQSLQ